MLLDRLSNLTYNLDEQINKMLYAPFDPAPPSSAAFPINCDIEIPANINKIIIVLTNVLNVILSVNKILIKLNN